MGTLQVIAGKGAQTKEPACAKRTSEIAEVRSTDYLSSGVNEEGKRVWFCRAHVQGLHPRLIGPFARRSDAIDAYDGFLQGVLEALCDCFNDAQDVDRRVTEFIEMPAYLKGQRL